MWTGQVPGQGWLQLSELGLAFLLSALIGIEREIRQKSAGFRTYTLVGFSAALIMLVSKYGFTNVLEFNRVVLDPSRIAAQIVTGIGFIGGGLIFVRRGSVRGLTTAAVVWLTAAVGMACGAGLPILALAVTGGHFVIVLGFQHYGATTQVTMDSLAASSFLCRRTRDTEGRAHHLHAIRFCRQPIAG